MLAKYIFGAKIEIHKKLAIQKEINQFWRENSNFRFYTFQMEILKQRYQSGMVMVEVGPANPRKMT